MGKEVYVVTKGRYSDYSIVGIFSQEAKADAYVALHHPNDRDDLCGDGLRVEPWDVDAEGHNFDALSKGGRRLYRVRMEADGTVDSVYDVAPAQKTKDYVQPGYPDRTRLFGVFQMWAKDEDHAVKIANERRAAALAAGRWEPWKSTTEDDDE
jgi:hypothetical protein